MDPHRPAEAAAVPRPPPRPADPIRAMRTKDLVTEAARKASQLVKKEIELAKAEVRADLRTEVKTATGLGIAAVCALLGLETLLVALVLALWEAGVLSGWAGALIVAGVVLAIGAIAGLWGWRRRVRRPLETTRRSLKEDVRWARERMA
jgi:uncharacterized membrane protein YqjE